MASPEAFAELLRRHEELTQRFATLLHDDSGQVLTAIALELSVIEGIDPEGRQRLLAALEDLLERFRTTQASLGAAVVASRGLAAGLSLLARSRPGLRVHSLSLPAWPTAMQLAAFRLVEALAPAAVHLSTSGLELHSPQPLTPYAEALAASASLQLTSTANPHTIKVCHAHPHPHR
jgi:signal transduction histidine kinase